MPAHPHYETLAADWQHRDRPAAMLLSGYRLIALRCWSWSDGAKADGLSETLQAFLRESNAAQHEDWLDDYMSDRETCRPCGESYKFENLSLCTQCLHRYCFRCAGQAGRAANGNAACACGGEVVG